MQNKKVIALVIYPGMSPLDIVRPVFMLGNAAGTTREYAVTSVGQRREPAGTDTPLQLIPEKTFDETPEPYGLIVPYGGPQAFPIRMLPDRTFDEEPSPTPWSYPAATPPPCGR